VRVGRVELLLFGLNLLHFVVALVVRHAGMPAIPVPKAPAAVPCGIWAHFKPATRKTYRSGGRNASENYSSSFIMTGSRSSAS
jgi:hypothetical protein